MKKIAARLTNALCANTLRQSLLLSFALYHSAFSNVCDSYDPLSGTSDISQLVGYLNVQLVARVVFAVVRSLVYLAFRCLVQPAPLLLEH